MAYNYYIQFVSLRSGTLYTLDILGGDGTSIELKGADQPFTTQEDNTDDFFTPIRTQTGYIRIIDDGLAADDETPFDWRDLIPATGTSRPVILNHYEGGNYVNDWMGYIQPQNFSGVLYGKPQVREFPVFCGLSGLQEVTVEDMQGIYPVTEPESFAYTLYTMFSELPTLQFDTFAIQGGSDAREWLMKRLDWRNFYNSEGTPTYNAYQILEEICKFWGWTARTDGQTVYFTCMDDPVEQNWLMLDLADLGQLSSSSGYVDTPPYPVALTGDIFVSTDNEEMVIRGKGGAVVKSDVNKADTLIKFAPKDLEEDMGEPSQWVGDTSNPAIGYFHTNTAYNLDGISMSAISQHADSGFERRVIFTSEDAENGSNADVIMIRREPVEVSGEMVSIINIETKNVITFSEGSLSIKAQLFNGSEDLNEGANKPLYIRVGIGMRREDAKWFFLETGTQHSNYFEILSGWDDNTHYFALNVNNNQLNGALLWGPGPGVIGTQFLKIPRIPVDVALYGYLYIDILGMPGVDSFEIANLEVDFTRKYTYMPTRSDQPRPRTVGVDLGTEHEYESTGSNGKGETWEVNLIFASDYWLEYGYGLLMNPNGSFMETVPYNDDTDYEFAEQHLANRVAAYWETSRRMLTLELNADVGDVADVSPLANVTIDGDTFYPVSINRDWWNETKTLRVMEIPSST